MRHSHFNRVVRGKWHVFPQPSNVAGLSRMLDTWLLRPSPQGPSASTMPSDPSPSAHNHDPPEGLPGSTQPPPDSTRTAGSLSQQSLTFGLSPRSAPLQDPLLGLAVAGVTIERFLAEGGMGRVYVARQHQPARTVAVKFIRSGRSPASVERFQRESQVLGQLTHPGIVRLFFSGTTRLGLDDVPFSVMEYVADAETLLRYCNRHELPLQQRLELFVQICEAVAYGHQRGVVHRDLKPSNVLVTEAHGGQPPRVRLIDFGLAKFFSAGPDEGVTVTGEFLGTRQYMSPEQFAGDPAAVDARSDVYALGVVLHELITGRLPYDLNGLTLTATAAVVRHQRPQPLQVPVTAGPSAVRRGLRRVAATCLQKQPARRYPSARELAGDVRKASKGERLTADRTRGRQVVEDGVVTAGLMSLVLFVLAMLFPPPGPLAPASSATYRRWSVSPESDSWREHLVAIRDVEVHTLRDDPRRICFRPTQPGVEGQIVFCFDAPFPIRAVHLQAAMLVWSPGDPFPYDPDARAAIDISPDGEDWTVLNVRDAQAGGGFFMVGDIGPIVRGSRQVWIRGRLRGSVPWPGEGLIHAQFLHTLPGSETPPLVLEVAAGDELAEASPAMQGAR